jgi:hypothetical protein
VVAKNFYEHRTLSAPRKTEEPMPGQQRPPDPRPVRPEEDLISSPEGKS